MKIIKNQFLNVYTPKIGGILGAIIVASSLFIQSYPPTNCIRWIGISISVAAAIFGSLISILKLEFKIKMKVELCNENQKDTFNKFNELLQIRYKTKIVYETDTEVMYMISFREKQFYYNLTNGINDELNAKEFIEISVDYDEDKNNSSICHNKIKSDIEFPVQNTNTAFTEILTLIRNQDNLIHSWTKYLLSIQAGLGIALAYLLKLGNEKDILVLAGSLLIPILSIATLCYLINIIVREHHWQGKAIKAFRELKDFPMIYDKDPNPNPKKHGYIARQFIALRIILIIVWLSILICILCKYILPNE